MLSCLCFNLRLLSLSFLTLVSPETGFPYSSTAVEDTREGATFAAIISNILAKPSGVPWFVADTSTLYLAELSLLLVLELCEETLPLTLTLKPNILPLPASVALTSVALSLCSLSFTSILKLTLTWSTWRFGIGVIASIGTWTFISCKSTVPSSLFTFFS